VPVTSRRHSRACVVSLAYPPDAPYAREAIHDLMSQP